VVFFFSLFQTLALKAKHFRFCKDFANGDFLFSEREMSLSFRYITQVNMEDEFCVVEKIKLAAAAHQQTFFFTSIDTLIVSGSA